MTTETYLVDGFAYWIRLGGVTLFFNNPESERQQAQIIWAAKIIFDGEELTKRDKCLATKLLEATTPITVELTYDKDSYVPLRLAKFTSVQ